MANNPLKDLKIDIPAVVRTEEGQLRGGFVMLETADAKANNNNNDCSGNMNCESNNNCKNNTLCTGNKEGCIGNPSCQGNTKCTNEPITNTGTCKS